MNSAVDIPAELVRHRRTSELDEIGGWLDRVLALHRADARAHRGCLGGLAMRLRAGRSTIACFGRKLWAVHKIVRDG